MIVRKSWTQQYASTSNSRGYGDSCKMDMVTFRMFAMQSIIINWFTVVFSIFQSLVSTLKFSSRVSKPNGITKHRKIGSIFLLNISVFSMLSISPPNIISWLVVLASIVTGQERSSHCQVSPLEQVIKVGLGKSRIQKYIFQPINDQTNQPVEQSIFHGLLNLLFKN